MFNNRLIGLEGDCFAHYYADSDLKIVIGILPELYLTLQAATINEFFTNASQCVEDFLNELAKEKNIERWAVEHGVQVRMIVNFLYFEKRKPKLPNIIFIEEETLRDLESQVRL